MNGNVEIFVPKTFKVDDIEELGEGYLEVSDVRKTGLTVITKPDYDTQLTDEDEDVNVNGAAIKVLSAIDAFGRFVTGYSGDLILAGPLTQDGEYVSGIPEVWMNKIEAFLK